MSVKLTLGRSCLSNCLIATTEEPQSSYGFYASILLCFNICKLPLALTKTDTLFGTVSIRINY